MTDNDKSVMYIIVREDLPMTPGKVAAQVGHAVQLLVENCYNNVDDEVVAAYGFWKSQGNSTKIVLGISDFAEFTKLKNTLKDNEIYLETIIDAGHTEIEPNTITCMGIEPMLKSSLEPFLKDLRPYKIGKKRKP